MSSCRKRERGELVKEQFFRRGSRAYRSSIAVYEWAMRVVLEKPSLALDVYEQEY